MKLKELRKKNGHSLQFVAEQLNIAISTYRLIEMNKSKPCVRILSKISNLYSVPISELFEKFKSVN